MMTVAVMGEALIDLIEDDKGAFKPFPGGSPFNVSIALARQGVDVSYLSLLSNDQFGKRLHRTLEDEGVRLPLISRSSRPTSLALVAIDRQHQPSYQFYRQGVADKETSLEEVVDNLPSELSLFHTGSLALTPSQLPKVHALFDLLNKRGIQVSVDINIRLGASSDSQKYLNGVWSILAKADIVKASDEDLDAFSLDESVQSAAQQMFEQIGSGLLIVTEGARGVTAFSPQGRVQQNAHAVKQVVDTVGAGDCFHAAFLAYLLGGNRPLTAINSIPVSDLQASLDYACAAAAINIERSGCSPPSAREVQTLLKAR